MYDLKEHLRTLIETHAPSGFEANVRTILYNAWVPYTDEFIQDGMGSLIGVKRASQPLEHPRSIMLAAHMDEIGMMVRDVIDGFVLVTRISGVDNRVMPAQNVIVHGRESLPGIVATKPPHLLEDGERSRYPGWDSLLVDVGLPASEVEVLVRPGDMVTVDAPMIDLNGRKVAGKAMDDRACVAAVTHCLHLLQGMQHRWDVYAAATVQEETGLKGAATAAHTINPDVAIALDVGFAAQPGVSADESLELGGGPALSFGPNFHIKLFEAIHDTAKSLEMKLQDDITPGRSGTDAWAIQVSHQGVPTALLNVPLRNMHSPIETADLRDIERAGRLLAHFIAGLDENFLSTIDWTRPQTDAAAD